MNFGIENSFLVNFKKYFWNIIYSSPKSSKIIQLEFVVAELEAVLCRIRVDKILHCVEHFIMTEFIVVVFIWYVDQVVGFVDRDLTVVYE